MKQNEQLTEREKAAVAAKVKEILSQYPVIEFDVGDTPKIDPENMFAGESLGSDKLIITFFPETMEKLKAEGKITLHYTIDGENPVEIYQFVDSDVMITLGYVGCPACAGNLECFYAMGIRKVMFCGGGGVLDSDITVGTLLVVKGAIRDEGFSFQYVAPGRVIYTDPKVNETIENYLKQRKIPYITGLTWTTDALFRETSNRKAES